MPEKAAFDHVIHWVNDLDDAMHAYAECGLPTHEALTMPGFRNGAWGIDDERYVELATVDDWDEVRASKYAEGIEILKPAVDALQQGCGLLTFAVNVADARATAERLRAAGREVEVTEVWFDDQNAGFVEVFVRDAPAYFPFFITYDPPRAELGRMRAEHRAAAGISVEGRPDLAALLVGSADPEGEARQLANFVGRPVRGTVVDLPGAQIRFQEDSPPRLHGLSVRGSLIDRSTTIAGATLIAEH